MAQEIPMEYEHKTLQGCGHQSLQVMENEDNTADSKNLQPATTVIKSITSFTQTIQGTASADPKGVEGNEQTEQSAVVNSGEQQLPDPQTEPQPLGKLRQICACPPHGILDLIITNVTMVVLLWAVIWSITGRECLPGGNLFGILLMFYCAVIGGKLLGLIKFPSLPPLPPLLGMLLAGFLIRNTPGLSDQVQIKRKWSSSLRNIALAIILVRAGLGLDSKALKKLKAVCLRLSMGPCLVESCSAAVISHFLLHLPWQWGFILGFVLGAVSPAVVVPSMLILQEGGYGVDKGVPTLLMAAGSFDDILAITGFNTCLGMAFSTGSTLHSVLRGVLEVVAGVVAGVLLGFFIRYFPSPDQADVQKIIAVAWDVFQPLLFGLIGAEVSVASLKPETVGLCVAILGIALVMRILTTFLMVCCAGFNLKEKIFISLAWVPKATVQAAIGSLALDTARAHEDKQLEDYGMDVLTIAFLAILITAPIGALIIGLMGPKLLLKMDSITNENDGEVSGPV
ncbi:sodium/hydrogen exchanger 9B2 isoform X2 [Ornithorhynchus anatinus]|uniref:Solute carrier family 9 member B1 n=1 Tax=Ornithorhynchus anatinus TaxID=9258 RepID=K7EB09_ORNAN|nr:sodium/hydrogen exchanger 9B2 isoform X2 [Ornithorhynchus anatinus]